MNEETLSFIEKLKSFIFNLTDEEIEAFSQKLTIKILAKKDYFVKWNEIQNDIAFIHSGLLRSYYIDNDGNEKTVRFYDKNEYATHYTAFITRQPSSYFIQCIEPSILICINYETMQWAYSTFPKFERYGRLMAEEILKVQQKRIESFIFYTAEQRYLSFISQYPELFNRISLTHLSSYLGIERQSLTRIRQKLAHK